MITGSNNNTSLSKETIRERKKKAYIFLYSVTFFVFALFTIIYYLFNYDVYFSINGDYNIKLSYNENYLDNGANAKKCNKFKCVDISDSIVINNNYDARKIGTGSVSYNLSYGNKEYELVRNIYINDTESPTIKLYGDIVANVCPNKKYEEQGYIAKDNLDGNITSKVVKYENANEIVYEVTDSNNNKTQTIRTINYIDAESPNIVLKGGKTVFVLKNDDYKEYGYEVIDNCSSNFDKKVKITNNVDTTKEGKYKVTYTVEDDLGNVTSVDRNVIVYYYDKTSIDSYAYYLEEYLNANYPNSSVIYYNLTNGYTYKYNDSKVYYGASLIKTLDAMYVFEKMKVNNELDDLVKEAITVSDNAAHKRLVEIIGADELHQYGNAIGATNITISRYDYFGNTTANDQLAYMKYLYEFINNNENSSKLIDYFANDYCNYIALNNGMKYMHKYGYFGIYYHDVGIALGDYPYIIVVLTQYGTSNYDNIINDISSKVYELHKIASN